MDTNGNTKELIKDLCSRLPYGVKVNVIYSNENASSFRRRVCVEGDNELNTDIIGLYQRNEIDIKPYLFPLSSMTEEQWKEIIDIQIKESLNSIDSDNDCMSNSLFSTGELKTLEWCYANHIDIHNLIPKGLAIDATGLNIY